MRFYRVGLFLISLCFSAQHTWAAPKLSVMEQKISDSLITTKINTNLAKRGSMNPLKLHVSTKQGVVSLRGAVPDKKTFVAVLRVVKSTKGVQGVDIDAFKIKKINTPITDAYITAKVEAAVLKAKVFDDESIPLVGINAHTINGRVALSGEVKKRQSIACIIKRVSQVKGVKHVSSQLRVAKNDKAM